MPNPTPIRQKACNACSNAKVRCDKDQSTCLRCRTRGLVCSYPQSTRLGSQKSARTSTSIEFESRQHASVTSSQSSTVSPQPASLYSFASAEQLGDFSPNRLLNDTIVCNFDSSAIENRWLKSILSTEEDTPKNIPAGTISYIREILRSYVGMAISHSHSPPFIHQTHGFHISEDSPLAQCYGLLRFYSVSTPVNTDMIWAHVDHEMVRIVEEHASYSDLVLLAAFQAYLLYTMLLYFKREHIEHSVLHKHMTNLQQMASVSVSQGIVTAAEMNNNRPDRRFWILVESKRRTLYTMYLFDNLLCASDELPVFVAIELRDLLAPNGRALWEAESSEVWTRAYNQHISAFDGGSLRLGELWPPSPGISAEASQKREDRIARWLQGVDVFGNVLFAITTHTYVH